MWICRKINSDWHGYQCELFYTASLPFFFPLPSSFLLSLLECPPASVHRSGAVHLKFPLPSALSLVSFTPLYDWTNEKPVQAVVTVKRVIDAAGDWCSGFIKPQCFLFARNMSWNIQSRDFSSCVSYEPIITLTQRWSKVSICVLCVCAELNGRWESVCPLYVLLSRICGVCACLFWMEYLTHCYSGSLLHAHV